MIKLECLLESCIGIYAVPRMEVSVAEMATNAVRLPRGQKNILRNSHGNVTVFNVWGASAAINEFAVHIFRMQNIRCIMFDHNDNAN